MTQMPTRNLLLWIFALASACFIGYVNTHTDEVTVVAMFMLMLTFALGFVQPRLGGGMAWLWWLLCGAAVPVSQLTANVLNLHVPYPNSLSNLPESCIAFVPAAIGTYSGLLCRWMIWGRQTRVHAQG